jgi:hypothetical protein
MPFAQQRRGVALVFQHPRDGGFFDRQARFFFIHVDRPFQTDALLIAPGDEGRARRRADGAVGITLRQFHAFFGEPVNVGRANVF